MYLLDTDVISAAARRSGAGPAAAVAAWIEAHSAALHLSTVTVTEIEGGIAKLRREAAVRRAAELGDWLEAVLHLYHDRIIPFDVPAARIAGRLTDRARALGQAPGFADIAIAATALSRGLTLLTRNLRHMAPLGVAVIDPFAVLPVT